MAKYKQRLCNICGEIFNPTSPNQKYCINCKEKGKKIVDRVRDRKRSRDKYGYTEYHRRCKVCGKEFITYYSKKKYCGLEECEKVRVQRENNKVCVKRNKKSERVRKYNYYWETRKDRLKQKALEYRKTHNTDKVYTSKNFKCNIDHVRNYVEKFGYKLLSKEYKNGSSKIKLLCSKGHKWQTTFGGFKNAGARCLHCYLENKRLPYDDVNKFIISIGYQWVDGDKNKTYSSRDKITYKCKEGHLTTVNYGTLKSGFRCRQCFSDGLKRSFDEIKKEFDSFDYKVVSDNYVNNKSPFKCVCPNGHNYIVSYSNFHKGHRCMKCFSLSEASKAEKEIADFVLSLVGGENIIRNDRNIIAPYELDIVIPDKKLAIEYCGLYWHSETAGGKSKKYHYDKMIKCNKKGIRLITIFEDEYLNRPEVVKSRIKYALGYNIEKIYARKCDIRELSYNEAQNFLDLFHLQGCSVFKKAWGLFYMGDMVQVLSIGSLARAHTSHNKKVLELKRLASFPGVVVVGGASKLFKQAKKFAVENTYDVIKSYADMRWAIQDNAIYDKLGFILVSKTRYTPHYVMGAQRFRNQGLRKTIEERKTGKTEFELRREQGYDRIWDCGHRTYLYEVIEK